MNKNVLGLDLASNTGYALIENGDLADSGTKSFTGDLPKRLADFEDWLEFYISLKNPNLIVYEIPHFRGYAATMSGVGLSSITLKVGYTKGFPVIGVRTTTLKSFATNNGKATKEEMTDKAKKMVASVYNSVE
jgi:Holliday junction resolvasome RuvABC endonuclease subunit